MFRKVTAAILAVMIILTLAACGDPAFPGKQGGQNTPGQGDGDTQPPANNEKGEQSYAGAYTRSKKIIDKLTEKLEAIITPYNEKRELEDEDYNILNGDYIGGSLAPFFSIDRAFTATFNENCTQTENMAGIELALSFFGAENIKLVKNAANDYTLTFTVKDDEDGAADMRMDCKWDPATDAMRYVARQTENGTTETSDYFEYIALGGGAYALQSRTERAYVKMDGDKLTEFVYTISKNDTESGGIEADTRLYDVDTDSVFGKNAGIDKEWAKGDREDIGEIYIFDGTILTVERCVAQYEGTSGEYTAREWVWKDIVTITPEN